MRQLTWSSKPDLVVNNGGLPWEGREKTVEMLIDSMDKLAPVPQVVHRALACMGDGRSSSVQLAQILSTDQSLSGRLLGMANSAYYRGESKFATVQQAIVRLGYRQVRELLMATVLSGVLYGPLRLYELTASAYWNHSLGTAVAARMLAELTAMVEPDAAYLSGLLHDAGRAVLNNGLHHSSVSAVLDLVRSERILFHEAEQRVLGFTHGPVGAAFLRRWHVDEDTLAAVGSHHYGMAQAGPLACVTHVADVLATIAFPNTMHTGWMLGVDRDAIKLLGLEEWQRGWSTDLDEFVSGIRREVAVAAKLIGAFQS